MTKPRFFSRIIDSLGPLLGGDLAPFDVLASEVVLLRAPESIEHRPEQVEGFLLAANLCARLYPRLTVAAGDELTTRAYAVMRGINPAVALHEPAPPTVELAWSTAKSLGRSVSVTAAGWNVIFGDDEATNIPPESNPLTALAAAALGTGELLRLVFAGFLPSDRQNLSRGRFNLLRWGENVRGPGPDLPRVIDLGEVGLVGAGAIGQAFVYALARVSGLQGSLTVYDPEEVSTSNLQRYVLTSDTDVGTKKTALVKRTLLGGWEVKSQDVRWEQGKEVPAVLCVALDDPVSRIQVQSALPRSIYNAWTQPDDLGWSIHERFGAGPCLACLYWPTRQRPGYHELIAEAIGEHPVRILGYLIQHITIGEPLVDTQVPRIPDAPLPDGWQNWKRQSLLDDLADKFPRVEEAREAWREKEIGDLYREGVCGGALLSHVEADVSVDVAVPLAHQSVMAGVMLAVQLIAGSIPELADLRPAAPEGRIDVLRPLPQVVARPRAATQECICQDADFRAQYNEKWGYNETDS